MRNFDTTTGLPFVYFDLLSVTKNPQTGDVVIVYQDRMALKSVDGRTNFLDHPPEVRTAIIRAADMGKGVPLVDLSTGRELGAKMSYGQIMMGIIAAIRADQTARDVADDAAAEAARQAAAEAAMEAHDAAPPAN